MALRAHPTWTWDPSWAWACMSSWTRHSQRLPGAHPWDLTKPAPGAPHPGVHPGAAGLSGSLLLSKRARRPHWGAQSYTVQTAVRPAGAQLAAARGGAPGARLPCRAPTPRILGGPRRARCWSSLSVCGPARVPRDNGRAWEQRFQHPRTAAVQRRLRKGASFLSVVKAVDGHPHPGWPVPLLAHLPSGACHW